jgi:hypothetical protein
VRESTPWFEVKLDAFTCHTDAGAHDEYAPLLLNDGILRQLVGRGATAAELRRRIYGYSGRVMEGSDFRFKVRQLLTKGFLVEHLETGPMGQARRILRAWP